jgi:hypothetical protein
MTYLNNIISSSENIELTGEDLSQIVGDFGVNIVLYEQLKNYNSIFHNDLLGKHNSFIILFQLGNESGHWICINLRDIQNVDYYDSYGLGIDAEVRLSQFQYDARHTLTALLNKAKYDSDVNIHVNRTQVQKLKDGINTCGRFAALRSIFRALPNYKFNEMIEQAHFHDADEVVTALTVIETLRKPV